MEKQKRDLSLSKLSPAATAVTAAGFGLVLKGCNEIGTLKGVSQIGIGRGLDLVDGWLARKLGQESDAGAMADAAVDKFGLGAISIAGWLHGAMPKPAIATVVAKNAASAALTFATGRRHPEASFRPTKWGKVSVAADSIAYGAYLAANALKNDSPELVKGRQVASLLGHAAMATSIVSGVISLAQYTKRAL